MIGRCRDKGSSVQPLQLVLRRQRCGAPERGPRGLAADRARRSTARSYRG
jgi:hypothetical protein